MHACMIMKLIVHFQRLEWTICHMEAMPSSARVVPESQLCIIILKCYYYIEVFYLVLARVCDKVVSSNPQNVGRASVDLFWCSQLHHACGVRSPSGTKSHQLMNSMGTCSSRRPVAMFQIPKKCN